MAGTRTLKIEILGDAKGLGKAFGEADGHASKLGKSLGAAGKLAGGALLGIGAAAFALGPQVLSAGAELDALGKKAETVFSGSSLNAVTAWADGVAASMGMTTKQAVGVAAGIGDLLKPMGFTADEAGAMSTKMLDLSGALSAWSGGTIAATEVADIMTKAMLGETDGLKALGISISAADVEARLLAKGQQDLTGSALEQAKALVVQELMFEKSADAQAAWADGSMDAVKRQAQMGAALASLKETLVTAIYPVLAQLVPILTDVATWLGEKVPGAITTFKGFFVDVFEGGKLLVEDLAEAFNTSEGTIVKVLGGIALGFVAIAVAWNAGPGLIVTAVVALVAGLVWAYGNVEWFRAGVKKAFEVVKLAFDNVSGAALWLWGALKSVWDRTEDLRAFLADAFVVGVGMAKAAFDNVTTGAGLLVDAVQAVWDKSESLRDFLAAGFKLGIEAAGKVIGGLKDAIDKVVGAIQAIIDKTKTAIDWLTKLNPFAAEVSGKIDLGGRQGDPGFTRNAWGGNVLAGEPVRVGERGRSELFVPTADGMIVPGGGGGGGVSIVVNGSVLTERQLAMVVADGLTEAKRRGVNLGFL
jgi:hypothetical protein